MPAATLPAEPLISLNVGAARVGSSRHSLLRWGKTGAKGANGSVVRLAIWRVGMTWKTTESALNAFVAATTGDRTEPTPVRTPALARRASEAAVKLLIAKGC
jgi:hypothetical protein